MILWGYDKDEEKTSGAGKKVNEKSVSAEKKVEEKKEENKINSKDIKAGSKTFFGGIALGGGLYAIIVWLLFYFLNLPYAVIATMAFVIAVAFLIAFQKSTGLEATRMQSPILVTMFVIFILIISYHYSNNIDLDKNIPKVSNSNNSFQSETLTFVGDERLVAKAYLPIGKEYRVTVHGSCVNFIKFADIEVLAQEHGTYIFRITSEGSLIFDGTGSQSIVTIEWKE